MAAYNYYGQNYPAYFPVGYQPMYQPQVAQAPSVQPQVAPAVQQPQVQVSNVWVNSKEEADQFFVAPNNAVRLWSTKEPVFYLKQADVTGKPSLKVFDVVERVETPPGVKETSESVLENYVTKDTLSKVSGALKNISNDLSSLKSELDSIKGDVYGIAGKKKSVRKPEVIEDDA